MAVRGRDIRLMREQKQITVKELAKAVRKRPEWICNIQREQDRNGYPVTLEPEDAELLIVTINDLYRAKQGRGVAA